MLTASPMFYLAAGINQFAMRILLTNIKGLVQADHQPPAFRAGKDMKKLPVLGNAFLLIENDKIAAFGPQEQASQLSADEFLDCSGRFVFPSFVDPHTHIVFAGSRESEFVDKINGLSYAEIAKNGGGILNSAALLSETNEQDLLQQSYRRLQNVIAHGTGAIEIKSGYGLNLAAEKKMLKVAAMLAEKLPIGLKRTFLGAHAVPKRSKDKAAYIEEVINEMLPVIAAEGLADYCDVFCEEGFFSVEESEKILRAAKKLNLPAKIHANQLHVSGGVQLGVKLGAKSVDHLESMGEAEIAALQGTDVMPTLLPGAAFYLNMAFPPARAMLEAGLPLALASDYNPGSAPSGNMQMVVSLACIKMRMTPEEAINAATINAAYAIDLQHEYGSISPGKYASLFITNPMENYAFMPYAFGTNHVDKVMLKGKWMNAESMEGC